MRSALALLFLLSFAVSPLCAADEPSLAERLPRGATVYVEGRGLAGKLHLALESELGRTLAAHEAVQEFLRSPQGAQFLFGQAILKGATGLDYLGLADALLSRDVVLARYGGPQEVVAAARVDGKEIERILAGAELLTKQQRTVVLPADETHPALWQLGPAYVCLAGDVLFVSADRALAEQVRTGVAEPFATDARLEEARRLAGAGALFVFVDLEVHGAKMRQQGKPKDLGQALILGAFSSAVPDAPWAAVTGDLVADGGALRLSAYGCVPAPAEPSDVVRESFGGTLEALPFALPPRTVAVARLRRSLAATWSNRDDLVAERGIPGLVEFETNFGNLTGGMDFVEQFLPTLRDADMVFLAARPEDAGAAPVPAVRIPEGAFLMPIRSTPEFAQRMQIAFQTGIGIVNATQGMMGNAFLLRNETYRGVEIQSARYLPPTAGELEATRGLPIRYNFEPSLAIVGDWLVLATRPGIVHALIDGRGGSTPVRPGLNAGLWVDGPEALAALRANREPLVARTMMEKGDDRATAERKVDLLLDLGRYVRSVAFTAEESRAWLGARFEAVLGPAGE